MNKILIAVFFVVAVSFLAAAGFFGANFNKPSAPDTGTGQPPAVYENNTGRPAAVVIKSFSFQPEVLDVKVGDSVTWINEDSAAHDVVSEFFKSPLMKTGEWFTFTFDKAGSYDYACGIHPSMKGKIIVR